MTIELDPPIVPTHCAVAPALRLARLRAVPCPPAASGWNEPDGHRWEMTTADLARASA